MNKWMTSGTFDALEITTATILDEAIGCDKIHRSSGDGCDQIRATHVEKKYLNFAAV